MGTEYCLGKHGTEQTPNGPGISLLAYEMSGVFDVYTDIPRARVEMDAWDDAARVNLWNSVDPAVLSLVGLHTMRTAYIWATPDEQAAIRAQVGEWLRTAQAS